MDTLDGSTDYPSDGGLGSDPRMEELADRISKQASDRTDLLDEFLHSQRTESLDEFIRSWTESLEELAARLDEKQAPEQLLDEFLRCQSESLEELFDLLTDP
jgi:hypothetical protein